MTSRSRAGQGTLYGVAAYVIWGMAPLFWQLLVPARPMEVLAHRVVWSMVILVAMVRLQGRWTHVRRALADRTTRGLLVVASALVGSNWALFIWATMSGHILDAALGYYVVPLLSVALGVVVLKERLRRLQWVALGISALGVGYVTVDHGSLPLIGLGLAGTWSVYGYIKKRAGVDAIESLAIESALLTPLAVAYLAYLDVTGEGTFTRYGVSHAVLLIGAGIFTASPLLLYGAAVVRAPLSTIGFLQYISSTIQFVLGLWVFHEPLDRGLFIGFVITWLALMVLSYDGVKSHRGLPPQAVAEPD